jgi:hypothetical protein
VTPDERLDVIELLTECLLVGLAREDGFDPDFAADLAVTWRGRALVRDAETATDASARDEPVRQLRELLQRARARPGLPD